MLKFTTCLGLAAACSLVAAGCTGTENDIATISRNQPAENLTARGNYLALGKCLQKTYNDQLYSTRLPSNTGKPADGPQAKAIESAGRYRLVVVAPLSFGSTIEEIIELRPSEVQGFTTVQVFMKNSIWGKPPIRLFSTSEKLQPCEAALLASPRAP